MLTIYQSAINQSVLQLHVIRHYITKIELFHAFQSIAHNQSYPQTYPQSVHISTLSTPSVIHTCYPHIHRLSTTY